MPGSKTFRPFPTRHPPIVLPPGPRGGVLGSALDIRRDPLGFCRAIAREYGDIVHVRFGIWPGYFVSHPEYVKHVLQDHQHNYSKDTGSFRAVSCIVGNGLLTSQGDFWLRQRRLVQPAFHRHQIATFAKVMTDATAEMLQRWSDVARAGQPFDVAHEMMNLTLRIVAAALFSADVTSRADTIGQAFTIANKALSNFMFLPYSLLSWPAPWNRHVWSAIHVLDVQVDSIIAQRRAAPDTGSDLLGMLLSVRDADTGEGMTDTQVRDELKTAMLAGYETIATLLSWAWALLSDHPEVERRLQAEVDTVLGGRVPDAGDLPNLPYTRMVIDEVLRLYPPVWAITRKAEQRDQLGDYVLPPNSVVVLSPYVTHRHPALWDEPDRFMPERWSSERVRTRPPFTFFPFGGGPRLCIGHGFAIMEAQLIVAMVAQRYQLRVVPDHRVEPEPMITLRPRNGVPVVLQERSIQVPIGDKSEPPHRVAYV